MDIFKNRQLQIICFILVPVFGFMMLFHLPYSVEQEITGTLDTVYDRSVGTQYTPINYYELKISSPGTSFYRCKHRPMSVIGKTCTFQLNSGGEVTGIKTSNNEILFWQQPWKPFPFVYYLVIASVAFIYLAVAVIWSFVNKKQQ